MSKGGGCLDYFGSVHFLSEKMANLIHVTGDVFGVNKAKLIFVR